MAINPHKGIGGGGGSPVRGGQFDATEGWDD